MTRVSDYASQQSILMEFMRAERSMHETQRQVATGKVSDDYQGIGSDLPVMLAAKSNAARADKYLEAGEQVRRKLDIQDLQLENFAAQATDLRQSVSEAVANNSGIVIMDQLDAIVRAAVAALNTEVNGNHLFGGSRTDVEPVNISNLADLQAAAAIPDIFENNALKPTARIGDNETLEYGFLAEDVATDFFDAIKRIADFNAGPSGPFGVDLTQAQATFLTSEIQNLAAIVEQANETVARNGVHFQVVDQSIEQNTKLRDFMTLVVSDIEDVDLAEAVTRLNADQVMAEATARVLADMTRLSLLDFI
ncbi:MAG: flagellin [Pseudomonadota bacterium]